MTNLAINNKTEKKAILKAIIVLAIPTIVEELLSTMLQYVDTAMVGHLGEKATAAVNVTTTISWLIGSIYSAIGVGIIAMVSKAMGQKDSEEVKSIAMQAVLLAFVMGIVSSAFSIALSPYIPKWMGAEADIRYDASMYFYILGFSVLFRAIGSIFGAAIRATHDTKTPLYISILVNVLNVLLNYIFIYILDIGVVGAALGSTISYFIFGIMMYNAYRKNVHLSFEWKKFAICFELLKKCIFVSIPVLATSVTSCLGYVFFARLVTKLGTTVFAAHSIAVTAETIFYIAGYGLRSATSTLIGNSLGEKNIGKYKLVSQLSIWVTMSMMCINGVVLFVVAKPLMGLLTTSKTVAILGAKMLRLVSFTEPFFGLMIISEGIFYGLGKTTYPFIVETISMWGVRILFTYFTINVWLLGLQEVWYCMIADNIFKSILLIIPILLGSRSIKKEFIEK